jgi:predicted ester cyclase
VPGKNAAAVERILGEFASPREVAVDQLFTADWVNHDPSLPPMQGLAGAAQLMDLWRSSFSNLKIEMEDSLEEGDKVACRFRITGTHTGPLMGIPASGKPISVLATGIFRMVGGKMAENWVNFDALTLMQQIGAVPAPGQASA